MSLFLFKRAASIKLRGLSKFPLFVSSTVVPSFALEFSADSTRDSIKANNEFNSSLPGTQTLNAVYSPDGKFLALSTNGGGHLQVYRRTATGFVKCDMVASFGGKVAPAILALNNGITFSPDSMKFYVFTYDYMNIVEYVRSADGLTYQYSRSVQNSNLRMISRSGIVSPDGQHFLYSSEATNNVMLRTGIYGSDRFLPKPSQSFNVRGMQYSKDSKYLFVASANPTYGLLVYRRSGEDYVLLPSPVLHNGTCLALSPDGIHVALGLWSAPYLAVFKWNPDTETLTSLPQNFSLPDKVNSISYSADGKFLAVGNDDPAGLSKVSIFKRAGDIYTKIPNFSLTDNSGTVALQVAFGPSVA